MPSLNQLRPVRNALTSIRFLWLTRLWGMHIAPTAKLSLSAKLDLTYPCGVHIGDYSYVAFGATILTHDMVRGLYVDTHIGNNCFVGARSIVLPGITVGDGSIVAAGSVVTRDVPPNTLVAGNPAQIIKTNIQTGHYGRLAGADDTECTCLSGIRNLCLAVLLAPTLMACAIPGAAHIDAPMAIRTDTLSMLKPGDSIKINVYGENDLNGTFPIDQSGLVTLPMLGQVQASGIDITAFENQVRELLITRGYLNDPIVNAAQIITRPVYIMGEVKNPGSYPYQSDLNVFKAIATAGGYTSRAAQNRVLIDRIENNQTQRMNGIEQTPLLPGDSIIVRERIF